MILAVSIAAVVRQSLQLQAHVTLASPGCCQTLGECGISCALDQCVSAFRAVEVSVIVCLRSSCYHVTGVGGP